MPTVFPPRAPITAPVAGTPSRFPIGRIYCVGRNYAAHAREMGSDPDREPPFFFLKDADAYVASGTTIAYPPETANYHHEIELVAAIGGEGFQVPLEQAAGLVFGYAVGLDMTRRDLQIQARELGRPWCTGKNFPLAAPMGTIHPRSQIGLLDKAAISLTVNGQTRQEADVADLIWSIDAIIMHLSRYYRLLPGDLIFTGTPEGVAAVLPGDVLRGHITGLSDLHITIGAQAG